MCQKFIWFARLTKHIFDTETNDSFGLMFREIFGHGTAKSASYLMLFHSHQHIMSRSKNTQSFPIQWFDGSYMQHTSTNVIFFELHCSHKSVVGQNTSRNN